MRHLPPHLSLEGVPPARAPKHSAAFGNRIALDRIGLEGLSVRYGVIYQSRAIVADNVRDADGNFFHFPSMIRMDAGASYIARRKRDSRVQHRFDLNVRNVFDLRYMINRRAGDKRSIIATYTLSL